MPAATTGTTTTAVHNTSRQRMRIALGVSLLALAIAGGREAECLDGAAEVRRHLGLDLEFALARGMRQRDAPGMQVELARVRDGREPGFLAAVLAVAQDRAAHL